MAGGKLYLTASNLLGLFVLMCIIVVFSSNQQDCGTIKNTYWRHIGAGATDIDGNGNPNVIVHTEGWGGLTYNCFKLESGEEVVHRTPKGKFRDCHRAGVGAAWCFSFAFLLSIAALVCGVQRQMNLGYKICAFGMFCSVFSSCFMASGITLYSAELCLGNGSLDGPGFVLAIFGMISNLVGPALQFQVPYPASKYSEAKDMELIDRAEEEHINLEL